MNFKLSKEDVKAIQLMAHSSYIKTHGYESYVIRCKNLGCEIICHANGEPIQK